MAVKPGYKQTEVGVIPDEWDAKPLGSILSKGRLGGNYANQDAEAELPLMKMGNLARGYFDLSKVQFITPGLTPDSAHQLVYGDVLFNTRNTLDLVGKVAIWRDELPVAYYNSNLMRLEFDSEQICSGEYANYSLNTEGAVSRLRALATGTTSVAAIYTRDLMNLQVLVPPLPEQRAIATALSDVDALLAKLDQLIAKKHDLKQATMQQFLTGQTRLPGFSGAWEVKRLGEVLAYLGNGAVYVSVNSFGLPVTRIETIADGTIDFSRVGYAMPTDELKKYKLQKGDILFSHINSIDHIGKVAIYDSDTALYHGMNLLLLRAADAITSRYLFYWLGSRQGRKQSVTLAKQAVSQASINTSEMKGIEIPLPPLPEQTAIAAVLSDMDAGLTALESRRDKTRALKQGMMQELLTGRIRLV